MLEVVNTTVFSLENGGGNPCPVVLNADSLTTDKMQKMTKDFAHESAFVLKSTRSDCDIKIRFFVPLHEMEMCIHATIGSITVLVNRGVIKHSPTIVETMLGPIKVEWEVKGSNLDVNVEQFSPEFLNVNPTVEEICKALCIGIDDINNFPIQSVSTSRYKLIIPLKSVGTLNNLKPNFEYLWKLCDEFNTTGFYPFAIEQESKQCVQARQFPKRAGYNEDPATGVAASALGAYLTENKVFYPLKDGWNSYKIIQGIAMGRPSIIKSETFIQENKIIRTRVKGNAIENSSVFVRETSY
ncbi:PhzF family phenazine biosynthesis isomerase [Aneurinibacillus aneurinilyticus]|uniref:PhzF family phenazine biosynthesis protein n=1 Tax=Aneurinibacillus aneurinilyticus TaxID=1391 RepID=UPI002E1DBBFC|nr:PhzF family phenazine biosynthesis isomerase [Aneurinibacillus aneurinilyticus]MED0670740.1 PhzF family phenazine biosynthesis isomerase [Aneurinibacillus aneurinilyticus]